MRRAARTALQAIRCSCMEGEGSRMNKLFTLAWRHCSVYLSPANVLCDVEDWAESVSVGALNCDTPMKLGRYGLTWSKWHTGAIATDAKNRRREQPRLLSEGCNHMTRAPQGCELRDESCQRMGSRQLPRAPVKWQSGEGVEWGDSTRGVVDVGCGFHFLIPLLLTNSQRVNCS